jgi:hypothetical protein
MSSKKKNDREREAEADDLLLRALRQLADEALEEDIPERLLRPLREAERRQNIAGQPRPNDAARDGEAGRRRRRTGSA